MTIDINTLRFEVQLNKMDNSQLVLVEDLLDRLEEAEKDIALKERVIDALGSKLSDVANERYALRIKIEQMERQEPVAIILNAPKLKRHAFLLEEGKKLPHKTKLYALPGAKGE